MTGQNEVTAMNEINIEDTSNPWTQEELAELPYALLEDAANPGKGLNKDLIDKFPVDLVAVFTRGLWRKGYLIRDVVTGEYKISSRGHDSLLKRKRVNNANSSK